MAVNKAADAPIFDIAHFGVVDDYRNFIPALIEGAQGARPIRQKEEHSLFKLCSFASKAN